MLRRTLAMGVMLAAVLAIGCEQERQPPAPSDEPPREAAAPAVEHATATAAIGEPAPDFVLEDWSGRRIGLTGHAGDIVVLEWINPDCPFVQRHYKEGTMARLAAKYADRGVAWLAINSTHYMGRGGNQRWAEQYELPYPILEDRRGMVGRLYQAKTTPHVFIIDREGVLVYAGAIDNDPAGVKPPDERVNFVDRALTEMAAGQPVTIPESKPYGCSVKYTE